MVLEIITEVIGLQWILINTLIFGIIYNCIIRQWSFFSENRIKFIRGFPLLGVHAKVLIGRQSLASSFRNCYNRYPKEYFIGIYELAGKPCYLIRDPELIKKITISDFDHFVNHQVEMTKDTDPLLSRTLFNVKDHNWRELRATLSPAFTGSKMRLMFGLIVDVAVGFCDHVKNEVKDKPKVYNMKELYARYASDTIATCSFGICINSLKDTNNEFYRTGIDVSNLSGAQALKFLGYSSIPKIMNLLKIKFFKKEHVDYFRKLVGDNIEYREKHHIYRPDMINLLMEAKKGTLTYAEDNQKDGDMGFATVEESNVGKASRKLMQWEDDDLVAQCLTFFFAGFATVSIRMCFITHELALNPDVQEKLYEEIIEVNKKQNGQPLSYDILQRMKYMDMVVSETLRRWALGAALDRIVNKPYVMKNYDGTKVQLNVGDSIWIPTDSIQMDPQYYPNPEKFDPERFSDENKGSIQSGTYFPFGAGPRNCIGSRFALMECKCILYHIVLNFYLEKSKKTQDPLILKNLSTAMDAEKGFWFQFRLRN